MNIIALPLAVPFLAFAYRLRGGGWVSLDDWEYRLIWGMALVLSYIAFSFPDPNPAYCAALLPLSYVAMLVPHAYCQNIGRWPTPQNGWPSFFVYTPDPSEWTADPGWLRGAHDFLCMACVGAWRATIVFLPLAACTHLAGDAINWVGLLCAVLALSFGQALGYCLGWLFPFSVDSSLTKNTSQWGEFFNGAAWAVALWLL
jgi:hypothetical protein